MGLALPLPEHWRRDGGGRPLAFILVLLIHALLAFLVLNLAPAIKMAKMGINAIEAFNILAPQPDPTPAKTPPPPSAAKAKAEPKPRTNAPQMDAPAPPTFDLGIPPIDIDIRKLPNRREEMEKAEAANTPRDSAIASAPAYGPSLNNRPSFLAGKTLYAAEWFREPTDAELSFYLPKNGIPRGSWALVACRTVANYRVEDCQEMGDSQPGSGLSRAIRNAAWQFRIRPPRVDGRYQVGEWVQIRIDFTRAAADPDAPPS